MGKSGTLLVLLLAACQPMYEGKPQTLTRLEPIKPPPTLPTDPVAEARYQDDCDFFTVKVPKVKRDPTKAEEHTRLGDTAVAGFDEATTSEAKTDLIVEGIDDYVAALHSDPFNAKATLKLAVAYDKVHRKGCALALLERLDQLAQNPKFATEANDAIDEILQRGNRHWFGGYRKDAVRAVGHPGHP